MKRFKKLLILGIVLLIISGIFVIAIKGFKVSLMNGKHESIELKIDKDVDLNEVENICKEVFGKRKFVLKKVEIFNDSFQLNIEYLTDDEKEDFISKINEKFEINKTIDDLNETTVPKIRIRDIAKLYIVPMIIVYVVSYIYILIRFRKIDPIKIILNNFYKTILTELIILSTIAVTRIPIFNSIFFILSSIAIIELVYCVFKSEDMLSKTQLENKKCA